LLIVAAKQATWPIHCHPSREENGEQARMEARGGMGRENEMGEHKRREGVKGRKEEEREKKKEEKNGETSDERKWKEGDGRRRRDERRAEREREICFGRCVYKIANDAQQLLYDFSNW